MCNTKKFFVIISFSLILMSWAVKSPLGRPRRRWEDGSSGSGMWGMDRIELVQDRDRWRELVTSVMNLRVPQNAGNFSTSCKPVSFSRTLLHAISKQLSKQERTSCEGSKFKLCAFLLRNPILRWSDDGPIALVKLTRIKPDEILNNSQPQLRLQQITLHSPDPLSHQSLTDVRTGKLQRSR